MRIDLRYLIVFAGFYVPGVLALIGGFLLGFTMDEMRAPVAIGGLIFGPVASAGLGASMFIEGRPMWLRLTGESNSRD